MSSKKKQTAKLPPGFNLWILNGEPPTIALGEEPPEDGLEWLECEQIVNRYGSIAKKEQIEVMLSRVEELEAANDKLKSKLNESEEARKRLTDEHDTIMFRLYTLTGMMGDEGFPETWPKLLEDHLRLEQARKHICQDQEHKHKQEINKLKEALTKSKHELESREADIHGLNDLVKDYEKDLHHYKTAMSVERADHTAEIERLRDMLLRLIGPAPKL